MTFSEDHAWADLTTPTGVSDYRLLSRSDTGEYVRELAELLEEPSRPAHASMALRYADRLFACIDAHLRAGGPLPPGWRVTTPGTPAENVYATACYDALSSALRDRGGAVADRASLEAARQDFKRLDTALRNGSPLPSPWMR